MNNQPAPLPKAFELDLGNNVKLKFARIEPGSFQMGSPSTETGRNDDESLHKVRIANPFAMGIYEVTQAQYRHVMGANPSTFSSKGDFRERVSGVPTDDFPADTMTWEDAIDFCRIVNLLPSVRDRGWTIDLPTEAEWEYAARGGTSTAFYSGNLLSSDQANFNGNDSSDGAPTGRFLARPTSVGSYKPNAWGLYDMHGNVSEWCKDWYDREYQNTDTRDNAGRVVRGGDWSTPAIDCRSAHRRGDDRSDIDTGFRVVVRLRENQKSTTR